MSCSFGRARKWPFKRGHFTPVLPGLQQLSSKWPWRRVDTCPQKAQFWIHDMKSISVWYWLVWQSVWQSQQVNSGSASVVSTDLFNNRDISSHRSIRMIFCNLGRFSHCLDFWDRRQLVVFPQQLEVKQKYHFPSVTGHVENTPCLGELLGVIRSSCHTMRLEMLWKKLHGVETWFCCQWTCWIKSCRGCTG